MPETHHSFVRSTARGMSPGAIYNEELQRARERGLPPPAQATQSLGQLRESSTTLPPPEGTDD